MRKQSVPCYIANGGVRQIVNVPMSWLVRVKLLQFCKELKRHGRSLETFYAAQVSAERDRLLDAMITILGTNFKLKNARSAYPSLTTAKEKKPKSSQEVLDINEVNMVDLSIKCGLIVALFLLGSFIQYLELN